jgi:large subunit ribosomal protein L7/L12
VSTQSHNVDQLVELLSQLSVLDMAKLKQALEEKWGVKAAAPAAAAAATAQGPAAAAESTEFKVTLEEVPSDKKIAVIKVLREVSGLSLQEAKTIAESAPKVLKESCPKAEAEEIAKKIKDAGAKVALQGL